MSRDNPGYKTDLVLVAIVVAAFAVRVAVSYKAVLGQDYVAFVESDAWYHMRLVDALIRQFPSRIWHDAYLLHPGGEAVNAGPLFDWIIAGTALLLGGGTPAPRLVDLVGAFTPPMLGALTVVPVYVLGRQLFSRRAGLWAAVAAAFMPGALLQRSVLGFTDHHCAEVLFSTLALMFVVLALDPARPESKRKLLALCAGFSLGAYLLTWGGGAIVVAMLVAWVAAELVLARLHGDDGRATLRVAVPTLGLPALMIAPWLGTRPFFGYDLLALGGGLAALIALHGLARATLRLEHGKKVYFVVATAVLLASVTAAVTAGRSSLSGLFLEIGRLSPWRAQGYVVEAAPLMQSFAWRPIPLWRVYTTSLFICLLALPSCISLAASRKERGVRLLLLWTLVSLAATFGQVRFAYYLAIGVALLAGFGGDLLVSWLAPTGKNFGATPRPEAELVPWRLAAWRTAVTASLALAIALPGLPSLATQSRLQTPLTSDRFDALQWMRTNTPEPFGDADAYYSSQVSQPSQYGVLAWWDFGYWLTRVARRVPATNPRQSGVDDAAAFFLADEPAQASKVLERAGVRYVLVDALWQAGLEPAPPEWFGSFRSMARAGGRPSSAYCETFRPMGGSAQAPALYCYPEYFRTMVVRLYAFGGKAVAAESVWVIEVGDAAPGEPLPIKTEWRFDAYEEALRFSRTRPAGQLRIVSKNLLSSCVPLEAAADYALVYRSLQRQGMTAAGPGPSVVQIFEFNAPGRRR